VAFLSFKNNIGAEPALRSAYWNAPKNIDGAERRNIAACHVITVAAKQQASQ